MDHQWRAAVLHLCLNPCRALPVAHPGCPVDHIQTLVNQSPGDLWMRCIGSILFVFCYLALGDELNFKDQITGNCMINNARILTTSVLFRKTSVGLP